MADGITRIAVEGFKSISKRQSIDIAPLTILAGANSSGKSSIMQPLLLLKQTLEAPFDPGPLFLSGPNIQFTSSNEFLSRSSDGQCTKFSAEVAASHLDFHVIFSKHSGKGLEIAEEVMKDSAFQKIISLRPGMSAADIAHELELVAPNNDLSIIPQRIFLTVAGGGIQESPMTNIAPWIDDVIHVPGLRGNRSRTFMVAAVGRNFPGTFDNYTASVILLWQKQGRQNNNYADLNNELQRLGLGRKVSAHQINEASIQLMVDDYDIADVGFGVSQILPVLVALGSASDGQLVYLEEPEIDLHPRAQDALARILANAAKRGVRVVAETHSSLLLRALQTLIAKGEIARELLRFHWFSRDSEGVTEVRSVTPDQNGAFGDWPEDFGDVALQSEKEYLDAVESKLVR
ncbi:MAG TPA: AAA family ATPase [Bryobacteraceae bacterium]|nr:AAA family ATPase [Bryobacteraceae bacterium]